MTNETIARIENELRSDYEGATATSDGGRRLVRLPVLQMPDGCKPSRTQGVVVLDPNAPKPDLYLREVPTLRSGTKPAVGTIAVAGETWQTFSFNLQWDESIHSGVQFVEGKLRRLSRGS